MRFLFVNLVVLITSVRQSSTYPLDYFHTPVCAFLKGHYETFPSVQALMKTIRLTGNYWCLIKLMPCDTIFEKCTDEKIPICAYSEVLDKFRTFTNDCHMNREMHKTEILWQATFPFACPSIDTEITDSDTAEKGIFCSDAENITPSTVNTTGAESETTATKGKGIAISILGKAVTKSQATDAKGKGISISILGNTEPESKSENIQEGEGAFAVFGGPCRQCRTCIARKAHTRKSADNNKDAEEQTISTTSIGGTTSTKRAIITQEPDITIGRGITTANGGDNFSTTEGATTRNILGIEHADTTDVTTAETETKTVEREDKIDNSDDRNAIEPSTMKEDDKPTISKGEPSGIVVGDPNKIVPNITSEEGKSFTSENIYTTANVEASTSAEGVTHSTEESDEETWNTENERLTVTTAKSEGKDDTAGTEKSTSTTEKEEPTVVTGRTTNTERETSTMEELETTRKEEINTTTSIQDINATEGEISANKEEGLITNTQSITEDVATDGTNHIEREKIASNKEDPNINMRVTADTHINAATLATTDAAVVSISENEMIKNTLTSILDNNNNIGNGGTNDTDQLTADINESSGTIVDTEMESVATTGVEIATGRESYTEAGKATTNIPDSYTFADIFSTTATSEEKNTSGEIPKNTVNNTDQPSADIDESSGTIVETVMESFATTGRESYTEAGKATTNIPDSYTFADIFSTTATSEEKNTSGEIPKNTVNDTDQPFADIDESSGTIVDTEMESFAITGVEIPTGRDSSTEAEIRVTDIPGLYTIAEIFSTITTSEETHTIRNEDNSDIEISENTVNGESVSVMIDNAAGTEKETLITTEDSISLEDDINIIEEEGTRTETTDAEKETFTTEEALLTSDREADTTDREAATTREDDIIAAGNDTVITDKATYIVKDMELLIDTSETTERETFSTLDASQSPEETLTIKESTDDTVNTEAETSTYLNEYTDTPIISTDKERSDKKEIIMIEADDTAGTERDIFTSKEIEPSKNINRNTNSEIENSSNKVGAMNPNIDETTDGHREQHNTQGGDLIAPTDLTTSKDLKMINGKEGDSFEGTGRFANTAGTTTVISDIENRITDHDNNTANEIEIFPTIAIVNTESTGDIKGELYTTEVGETITRSSSTTDTDMVELTTKNAEQTKYDIDGNTAMEINSSSTEEERTTIGQSAFTYSEGERISDEEEENVNTDSDRTTAMDAQQMSTEEKHNFTGIDDTTDMEKRTTTASSAIDTEIEALTTGNSQENIVGITGTTAARKGIFSAEEDSTARVTNDTEREMSPIAEGNTTTGTSDFTNTKGAVITTEKENLITGSGAATANEIETLVTEDEHTNTIFNDTKEEEQTTKSVNDTEINEITTENLGQSIVSIDGSSTTERNTFSSEIKKTTAITNDIERETSPDEEENITVGLTDFTSTTGDRSIDSEADNTTASFATTDVETETSTSENQQMFTTKNMEKEIFTEEQKGISKVSDSTNRIDEEKEGIDAVTNSPTGKEASFTAKEEPILDSGGFSVMEEEPSSTVEDDTVAGFFVTTSTVGETSRNTHFGSNFGSVASTKNSEILTTHANNIAQESFTTDSGSISSIEKEILTTEKVDITTDIESFTLDIANEGQYKDSGDITSTEGDINFTEDDIINRSTTTDSTTAIKIEMSAFEEKDATTNIEDITTTQKETTAIQDELFSMATGIKTNIEEESSSLEYVDTATRFESLTDTEEITFTNREDTTITTRSAFNTEGTDTEKQNLANRKENITSSIEEGSFTNNTDDITAIEEVTSIGVEEIGMTSNDSTTDAGTEMSTTEEGDIITITENTTDSEAVISSLGKGLTGFSDSSDVEMETSTTEGIISNTDTHATDAYFGNGQQTIIGSDDTSNMKSEALIAEEGSRLSDVGNATGTTKETYFTEVTFTTKEHTSQDTVSSTETSIVEGGHIITSTATTNTERGVAISIEEDIKTDSSIHTVGQIFTTENTLVAERDLNMGGRSPTTIFATDTEADIFTSEKTDTITSTDGTISTQIVGTGKEKIMTDTASTNEETTAPVTETSIVEERHIITNAATNNTERGVAISIEEDIKTDSSIQTSTVGQIFTTESASFKQTTIGAERDLSMGGKSTTTILATDTGADIFTSEKTDTITGNDDTISTEIVGIGKEKIVTGTSSTEKQIFTIDEENTASTNHGSFPTARENFTTEKAEISTGSGVTNEGELQNNHFARDNAGTINVTVDDTTGIELETSTPVRQETIGDTSASFDTEIGALGSTTSSGTQSDEITTTDNKLNELTSTSSVNTNVVESDTFTSVEDLITVTAEATNDIIVSDGIKEDNHSDASTNKNIFHDSSTTEESNQTKDFLGSPVAEVEAFQDIDAITAGGTQDHDATGSNGTPGKTSKPFSAEMNNLPRDNDINADMGEAKITSEESDETIDIVSITDAVQDTFTTATSSVTNTDNYIGLDTEVFSVSNTDGLNNLETGSTKQGYTTESTSSIIGVTTVEVNKGERTESEEGYSIGDTGRITPTDGDTYVTETSSIGIGSYSDTERSTTKVHSTASTGSSSSVTIEAGHITTSTASTIEIVAERFTTEAGTKTGTSSSNSTETKIFTTAQDHTTAGTAFTTGEGNSTGTSALRSTSTTESSLIKDSSTEGRTTNILGTAIEKFTTGERNETSTTAGRSTTIAEGTGGASTEKTTAGTTFEAFASTSKGSFIATEETPANTFGNASDASSFVEENLPTTNAGRNTSNPESDLTKATGDFSIVQTTTGALETSGTTDSGIYTTQRATDSSTRETISTKMETDTKEENKTTVFEGSASTKDDRFASTANGDITTGTRSTTATVNKISATGIEEKTTSTNDIITNTKGETSVAIEANKGTGCITSQEHATNAEQRAANIHYNSNNVYNGPYAEGDYYHQPVNNHYYMLPVPALTENITSNSTGLFNGFLPLPVNSPSILELIKNFLTSLVSKLNGENND